jgi:hypothetical protein
MSGIPPEDHSILIIIVRSNLLYSEFVQVIKNNRFCKYLNPQLIHQGMLFPLTIGPAIAIRIIRHRFLSTHFR